MRVPSDRDDCRTVDKGDCEMMLSKGGCDRELVAAKVWAELPAEDRELLRPVQARNQARGLCGSCHSAHARAGTLLDFPRVRASRADTIEDWHELADPARTLKDNAEAIAPRLGMTVEGLRQAVLRHRREQRAAA